MMVKEGGGGHDDDTLAGLGCSRGVEGRGRPGQRRERSPQREGAAQPVPRRRHRPARGRRRLPYLRARSLSPLRPSRRHGDRWVRSGPYEADAVGGPARAGAAPARAEAVLENRGAARPPGWRWRWRRPWACGGGREVRREGGGDPRALGRPRHGGTTTGTRLSAPLSAPVGPFLRREGRSPRGVRGRGR